MHPPNDWEDLYSESDLALTTLIDRLRDQDQDSGKIIHRKFIVDISEIGISMYWTVQFALSALLYYHELLPILAEEAIVVCPNLMMRNIASSSTSVYSFGVSVQVVDTLEAALEHYQPFLAEYEATKQAQAQALLLTNPTNSIPTSPSALSPSSTLLKGLSSPPAALSTSKVPFTFSTSLLTSGAMTDFTGSDIHDPTQLSHESPLDDPLTLSSSRETKDEELCSDNKIDIELPVKIIPAKDIPLITLDPRVAVPNALSYLNPFSYVS